jgi:hypothetical protein
MKPVEIVLRNGGGEMRENNGWEWILLRYIVSIYVNVTMYPPYTTAICIYF